MDRRDQFVKMEDPLMMPSSTISSFMDYFPVGSGNNSVLMTQMFEQYDEEGEKNGSSLGFMELLNMQDFGASVFDAIQQVPSLPSLQQPLIDITHENSHTSKTQLQETSEVVNTPATPNSSSISSESSAGQTKSQVVDGGDQEVEEEEEGEEDENQKSTKKHLKPKKTNQKRQREPRFAFMTKSEVDHLEDGYRWRKYGQKAVKNSPFPRSYYRCTTASCNVKKRVERSFNDPTVVVTTYEGQHTHPSPVMSRSGAMASPPPCSAFSSGGATPFHAQMLLSPNPTPGHFNYSVPLNCGYASGSAYAINPTGTVQHQLRFSSPASALLADHGLLQDIVPWSGGVKNEEQGS